MGMGITPRPFHGILWLENKGDLRFVWHDIYRCYGAYSATAGDLNNDGHLDIVLTTLFNDWKDSTRASLLWLENDGHQHFRPHTVARQPIHLATAAIADLDGDGRMDVIAGGLNALFPFERMGRLTWWRNGGAATTAQ